MQDFLSPLLQPRVVLWLASISLKLKPLFVTVHHTLTWDQNKIRIELSVLRDLDFSPHTNCYDYLCLAVLNGVSYFIPVAVAKYSDEKKFREGKGYCFILTCKLHLFLVTG